MTNIVQLRQFSVESDLMKALSRNVLSPIRDSKTMKVAVILISCRKADIAKTTGAIGGRFMVKS